MLNKTLVKIIRSIAIVYVGLTVLGVVFQEKMIFYPQVLPQDYQYRFGVPFEERNYTTPDGVALNTLFFPVTTPEKQSKGIILYFHGNAGSLAGWGSAAKTYTDMGYDVLIMDYRGFGKSGGRISSEAQLFADAQLLYDNLKQDYSEDKIVVLGYSIGTGVASHLASQNSPKLLILQAPYSSLADLARAIYTPLAPTFLLTYRLDNYAYVQNVSAPIVIYHGNRDEVVPYEQGKKLSTVLKPNDQFVTLVGQGHMGITHNLDYQQSLKAILE